MQLLKKLEAKEMLLKAGIKEQNCLGDITQIIVEPLDTVTLDSL